MNLALAAATVVGWGGVAGVVVESGGAAERSAFVAAAFARMQPKTPELESRFTWPSLALFQSTHDEATGAAPIRLIAGRAAVTRPDETAENAVVVGLSPAAGKESVSYYWTDRSRVTGYSAGYYVRHAVVHAPAGKWLAGINKPFSYTSGGSSLVFTPTAIVPAATGLDSVAWTDWTYATTLMAVSQPVYLGAPDDDRWGPKHQARARIAGEHLTRIEAAMRAGRTPALAAIAKALATPAAETGLWDDRRWAKIAAWAEKHRATDAAIGIRARFQPAGRCSMDSGPQEAATAYADLCFAAGRLGCFLDLQVQVMGDQFQRVAYSSYGEAVHGTGADRLRHIGIDAGRFLRGLVFRFAVPGKTRRELDPWRLARSMKEAGLDREMTTFLRDNAARSDLDAFNRLRAAQTYAYLRFVAAGGPHSPDDISRLLLLTAIRTELAGFNLPEPAAAWARSFGRGD